MPAIFISNQEASEIIEALEYAREWAKIEASHFTRLGISVSYEESRKLKLQFTSYSRLLTEIKRRLK